MEFFSVKFSIVAPPPPFRKKRIDLIIQHNCVFVAGSVWKQYPAATKADIKGEGVGGGGEGRREGRKKRGGGKGGGRKAVGRTGRSCMGV